MAILGIDVSEHNGTINWDKIKKDGKIKFAMLRAGFGEENVSQIDEQFERNYLECKRLGIPVGAYHYSYAFSKEEAKRELDFFLKIIGNKKFEYPVCYDVEDCVYVHPNLRITQNKLSKNVLTDIVVEFCSGLEKNGFYAGLYANLNHIKNHFNYEQIKCFDLWLAQWSDKRSFPCGIWQYSEKGRVKGINGYVDLNIAYKDYPTIIKDNELNNYKIKRATYEVVASKKGMEMNSAINLVNNLKNNYKMSVEFRKEDN